jgi:hypothetical protein
VPFLGTGGRAVMEHDRINKQTIRKRITILNYTGNNILEKQHFNIKGGDAAVGTHVPAGSPAMLDQ